MIRTAARRFGVRTVRLIELGRKDARKVLAEAGLIKGVGGGRQ